MAAANGTHDGCLCVANVNARTGQDRTGLMQSWWRK
jgi:hypothetical protein